ncbi:SHOCT domain-containing protein [Sporolactobacillus sp. CQH2019]|uniref:SHOCT domain-containing protein n=1 Tax=Sporolactobacillus sp. CQH2019 TaxID=3023512 RepID=UPI002368A99C|nr:SHOCT domain-containing protein [Sporolactobacillus sp. CQH2019]MDD9149314.1 SHOCT domain-containing protein [Sporolactobacillus sp. CQH2019]
MTDKKAYIVKKGFWTGNIFQTSLFKIQLNRLDAVNATTGIFWGHLELVTAGVHEKANWPNAARNCIVFHKGKMKINFNQAMEYINSKISKPEAPGFSMNPADEILKFKKLLDEGAITQDEFEKQKAKLLK